MSSMPGAGITNAVSAGKTFFRPDKFQTADQSALSGRDPMAVHEGVEAVPENLDPIESLTAKFPEQAWARDADFVPALDFRDAITDEGMHDVRFIADEKPGATGE